MMVYLQGFYKDLKKTWSGSLVKVSQVKQENAKEYLSRLAKKGSIEHIIWGWYWVPRPFKDVWDFLTMDKNHKVIAVQTAASFWNHDFIHRNIYRIKVKDESYGKALEAFGKSKGIEIRVEHLEKKTKYVKVDGLLVEDVADTIVDCIQDWAFTDALATLYVNRKKIDWEDLLKNSYWKRVAGTGIRAKQVLDYSASLFNQSLKKQIFRANKPRLEDALIRREIEESVEKVVELA